jgi:hypothetical protein
MALPIGGRELKWRESGDMLGLEDFDGNECQIRRSR